MVKFITSFLLLLTLAKELFRLISLLFTGHTLITANFKLKCLIKYKDSKLLLLLTYSSPKLEKVDKRIWAALFITSGRSVGQILWG